MKHLFIINPAAGKYDKTGEFTQLIREVCGARDLNYEILVSRAPGDCTKIAQAAAASGEELRIYACGGDGTLNEVANGAAGYPNAAITHFPGGTGNDFIKIFDQPDAFRSLERLLDADTAEFDLIRCGDHYSINICSVGFDARIGTSVSKYKRLPLVTGSGAYIMSTGVNLIKGIHRHYVIEIDGKRFDGRFTLACIANGRWYGGGFNPVPVAEPDDGLMHVLLVRDVSRLTVSKVIGRYKKGLYAELPQYIKYFNCKKVRILCDKVSEINLDGELLMEKEATFEIMPKHIRFFYPKGLSYRAKKKEAAKV